MNLPVLTANLFKEDKLPEVSDIKDQVRKMTKSMLGSGIAIVLFICALWMLSKTASPAVEVWKITSLNWEPYSSADMISQGNAIQDLRQRLKQHGIELQVDYYPWKRARKIARENGYIGYFPAWPNEVDEGFIASEPVSYSQLAVISKQDNSINSTDLKDIAAHYKIGFVKTYDYPDHIQSLLNLHPETGAMSDLLLLKMLISGRIDVVIADPLVLQYLSEKHGLGNIHVVHEIEQVPLVMAFHNTPDNKLKLDQFNKILRSTK